MSLVMNIIDISAVVIVLWLAATVWSPKASVQLGAWLIAHGHHKDIERRENRDANKRRAADFKEDLAKIREEYAILPETAKVITMERGA